MVQRVAVAGLSVEKTLHTVLTEEVLPATGISAEDFFTALGRLATAFGPENRLLLARREAMSKFAGPGKIKNIYFTEFVLQ